MAEMSLEQPDVDVFDSLYPGEIPSQIFQDLFGSLVAVEGIEMKSGHLGIQKLPALVYRIFHTDPYHVLSIFTIHTADNGSGDSSTAHLGEFLYLSKVHYGHDSRNNGRAYAGSQYTVHIVKKISIVEKQLRYDKIGSSVDFLLEVLNILFQ